MGRANRRRKKKKMSVWIKILLILGLFVIALLGGYWYGNITGSQEIATEDSKAKEIAEKAQKKRDEVHHYEVGDVFKIDENVIGKVKTLKTYPDISGPKYPIGLQIDLKNKSGKKVDLPYKYLFQLELKHKDTIARSVGIYNFELLKDANELVADHEKLKGHESRTLLYLFSTEDKKSFESKEAVLTIKTSYGKQVINIDLEHQKSKTTVSESESSSTEVIKQDSTSTTFEHTTQATADTTESTESTQESTTLSDSSATYNQPVTPQSTDQNATMNTASNMYQGTPQAPAQNMGQGNTTPANMGQVAPGTLNQGMTPMMGQ